LHKQDIILKRSLNDDFFLEVVVVKFSSKTLNNKEYILFNYLF